MLKCKKVNCPSVDFLGQLQTYRKSHHPTHSDLYTYGFNFYFDFLSQSLLFIHWFIAGITISLPGAESQDAERRRQIALRALSERLSKTEQSTSQWPSMDEPEQEKPLISPTPTTDSVVTGSESVESEKEKEKTPEVLVQI